MITADLGLRRAGEGTDIKEMIRAAHRAGYSLVAAETRAGLSAEPGADDTDYAALTREFNRPAPLAASCGPLAGRRTEVCVLRRLTLDFGSAQADNARECAMRRFAQSRAASRYDLLAIQVYSEAQFRQAVSFGADIVTLSPAASFKLSFAVFNDAWAQGAVVELQYRGFGPSLAHVAFEAGRCSRGRGVLVASGATRPKDLMELQQLQRYVSGLLGLSPKRVAAAAERAVAHGAARRLRAAAGQAEWGL